MKSPAKIHKISFEPCENSCYIHPFRMRFLEGETSRCWDLLEAHNSVSVLLFHKEKNSFLLVKQFRPAVFLKQKSELNSNEFSSKSIESNTKKAIQNTANLPQEFNKEDFSDEILSSLPQDLGYTHELCAGITDKNKSLKQIAQEEILEECGYEVELKNIQEIAEFYSSVGFAGSKQTMFFAEISEKMKKNNGGGVDDENIELVFVPLKSAQEFINNAKIPKTAGLCFGFLWFLQNFSKNFTPKKSIESKIQSANLAQNKEAKNHTNGKKNAR